MAEFQTELEVSLLDEDCVWELDAPLVYCSDIMGTIVVPKGFRTDFASVPRLPIAYLLYGDKAHRESVVHDYLYCINSVPEVSFETANSVFREAMVARKKPFYVYWPMYWAVCFGGLSAYHKRRVEDRIRG